MVKFQRRRRRVWCCLDTCVRKRENAAIHFHYMKNSTVFFRAFEGIFVSALLSSALLFTGCEKKNDAAPQEIVVPVQAQAATAKTVPLYIDTIGQTAAYNSVDIQPQVSGQLMQIHFQQGTLVKKGDLLYTIYQPPYQAELDAAKAQLARDQADLEINEKLVERNKVLLPQKYVAEQTYEQYEANVKMLKAAIEADKARIESAQINLNYCSITAPVDGLIGTYQVNVGNILDAGAPAVLTTIRQLNPLYVDFVVPSPKFNQVREYLMKSKDGVLDVEVTSLGDPSRKRVAKLKILGNQVSAASGTVALRAEVQNDDALFWPSEQISARIILTYLPNTVLVPQESVRYNTQGSFVWTVKNNQAVLNPVVIGQLQDGRKYGITQGVEAGAMVVTAGAVMLQPGSKVLLEDASGKPVGAPQGAPAAQDGKSAHAAPEAQTHAAK